MAVFRIEKTRDYTVMSNHHLRDMSLSLKAKGLLSLMLGEELFYGPCVRQALEQREIAEILVGQ